VFLGDGQELDDVLVQDVSLGDGPALDGRDADPVHE